MGNYMSVTTKECENCTAHYYDKTQSRQANFNHATPQTRKLGLRYTETGVFGYDNVCFARTKDADLCTEAVSFMALTDI